MRINIHEDASWILSRQDWDENESEPQFRIVNNTFDSVTVRQHLPDDHYLNIVSAGVCRNSPRRLGPNESKTFAWIDPLQKKLLVDVSVGGVQKTVDLRDITSHEVINLSEQRGSDKREESHRNSSISRWQDAYGGHNDSPPVRFGDHLAIRSVTDGLTWCTQREGGVQGYVLSSRSSTRTSPSTLPFAEAVDNAKARIKLKRSRSIFGRKSSKASEAQHNTGKGTVMIGDAVALFCTIDAQRAKVRHLTVCRRDALNGKHGVANGIPRHGCGQC